MKCPHCLVEETSPKWQEWNLKAAPYYGLMRVCLRCGGLAIYETRHILRRATRAEFDSVRNKPEWILMEKLRQHFLKRLLREPKAKKMK